MASITRALPLMLVTLTIAACSSGRQQNDQPSADTISSTQAASPMSGGPAGVAAGTYAGTLPCADCEGIRQTLVLEPDSTYYLRTFYMGRDSSRMRDELGRWSVAPDGSTLTLRGKPDMSNSFAIHGDTLRMLGADGRPNDTKLNFDIVRDPAAQPIRPKLLLHGMYGRAGEAGSFTDCDTRLSFPVAREGDNAALEAAYAKGRTSPGAEMLVTVEAHVAARPRADGAGEEKVLVVDKLAGTVPDGKCGEEKGTAALENTYWKLVMLGDKPVTTAEGRREAQMTLSPGEKRVRGFSSCNGFSGPYTLDGRKLSFGPILSTKMACVDGMDVETGFFSALDATASYTITGERLELFDAGGKALARFESVYLR